MVKAKTPRAENLPVLGWAARCSDAIIPPVKRSAEPLGSIGRVEEGESVTSEWREEVMTVAGIKVQVFHGGRGEPLLVLHGAGGNPGWLRFHTALAERFHVYAPSHPGFGTSDRPDWIDRLGDLAYFYRWFNDELRLAPLAVVGFSMGGWLAAEMAAMYPAH